MPQMLGRLGELKIRDLKTVCLSWIICLNEFFYTWRQLMPTGADWLVWSALVGFGGLKSALVSSRSGGDLLEQRNRTSSIVICFLRHENTQWSIGWSLSGLSMLRKCLGRKITENSVVFFPYSDKGPGCRIITKKGHRDQVIRRTYVHTSVNEGQT